MLSIDSIAPSGRFRPVNSINTPALAPYQIAFASPLPRPRPAVILPSPRPPFRLPSSSSRPPSPPDEDGDGDGDGDGDRHRHRGHRYPYPYCCHHRLLPAADSAAAVREHCHRCRIGGPVGGVVIDDDAVAADAPEASPLPRLVIPLFRNLFFGPKKAFLTGFLRIFFFLCFPEEFFRGTWFWRGRRNSCFFPILQEFFAGIPVGQEFLYLLRIPQDS